MRGAALPSRDSLVGLIVALVSLYALASFVFSDEARWPWTVLTWLAAAPFLLLLIPEAQRWLRSRVEASPGLVIAVPVALTLVGLSVVLATGTFRWRTLVLWPLATVAALAAVGRRGTKDSSGLRLVVAGLALAVLAGAWERTLYLRVPGGTKVGLAFFVALDLALFLFIAVRPLRSLDVRFGLSAKELGVALGALAVLAGVALPLGYAVGFVSFEARWQGYGFAAARLFGLILFVGLPEEMLFRGLLQEGLGRIWTPRVGWFVGSVLFGLAHITKHAPPLNWRYALIATFAGVAYGWVYLRTGKVSAAAVTHGGVNWIWGTYFGA